MPLPSAEQRILVLCREGLGSSSCQEVQEAVGSLLLCVCVWLRTGSKHELVMLLRAWVEKSSRTQMRIIGCQGLMNMPMSEW